MSFLFRWDMWSFFGRVTLTRNTNMTMENPPFDDAFPIENEDFPMSY